MARGQDAREPRRSLPSPSMALACVALFVALGGTGYAATHLPSGKDRASKVKRGSRGKPGPQGAAGDPGADGPVGPQGPRGALGGEATAAEALARAREAKAVKLQAYTMAVAEHERAGAAGTPLPPITVEVRCPDDGVVSGGGYNIVEFLGPMPVVKQDARVGNGWSVEIETQNSVRIKAYAVCLTPIP